MFFFVLVNRGIWSNNASGCGLDDRGGNESGCILGYNTM
jgi:hypothetical protein